MTFHDLQINLVKRETPNSVRIGFKVPDDLKEAFGFVAGQYLTLKTNLNGDEIRRDYSICSSPYSGKLEVVVKRVDNGTFSSYANESLVVGQYLEVAEPQGRFIFHPQPDQKRTISAFAAGSGITPVMGIMRTMLEKEPQSSFVLIYGNQSEEEAIFLNDIKKMEQDYQGQLSVQWVYSKSNVSDALFGRIDESISKYMLKKYEQTLNADTFYLCGPGGMIETVKEVLIAEGIDKDRIKYELFTSTPVEETTSETTSNGMCHVEVIVDDEEEEFDMPMDKTILEMALKAGVDAPYSCQGGICSSCIARITEGEVKMRQNNILTDSEVQGGLILTCQSEPLTPKVKIDYDDV